MTSSRRAGATLGLLASAGLVAALGAGPLLVNGADHLDAPTAKADHRIDITDIYAFKSAGGTTLVLNVNPLTSPADSKKARFRTGTLYEFLIDTNLDAAADIAYRVRFTKQTWPGETLTTSITVTDKREADGQKLVDVEVGLVNQDGEAKPDQMLMRDDQFALG